MLKGWDKKHSLVGGETGSVKKFSGCQLWNCKLSEELVLCCCRPHGSIEPFQHLLGRRLQGLGQSACVSAAGYESA